MYPSYPEGRYMEKVAVPGGDMRNGGHHAAPRVTFRRVCCCVLGPWTVARSSLRMLRRVAAF